MARAQSLQHANILQYDYVRLTYHDLYGVPRTRVVPGRHVSRFLSSGYSFYEGVMFLGPRGQLPEALVDTTKLSGTFGSVDCIPDVKTLRPLPWAGLDGIKVGEIICTLQTNGTPVASSPRYVAQSQLARLEGMGHKLLSTFEVEFLLEDIQTHEPVFKGIDPFSPYLLAENNKFFFQVDKEMFESGINIEMIQVEAAPGQFELTLVPEWGISGADKPMHLKHGLKEIAHQHGLEATFIAKPTLNNFGSGAHFNFSVWNIADGKNMFSDKNNDLGLSTFAQHWIGGMMAHGRALSALHSPTVHCYRRLHQEWAPSKVSWGIENRMMGLRVKVGGQDGSGTYMENRVPSSSANYYLVMAATIAAGLDGVQKKTQLPPQGNENVDTLPATLEEALNALEADQVIVTALGSEFVEWFCRTKRLIDLDVLKDSDMSKPDPICLAKEREMYNVNM